MAAGEMDVADGDAVAAAAGAAADAMMVDLVLDSIKCADEMDDSILDFDLFGCMKWEKNPYGCIRIWKNGKKNIKSLLQTGSNFALGGCSIQIYRIRHCDGFFKFSKKSEHY